MTDARIRSLNLAMAELCGYPAVPKGTPSPLASPYVRDEESGVTRYVCVETDNAYDHCFDFEAWSPVTNPAQALEVLTHWHGDVDLRRQNNYWWVTLYQPSVEWVASASTLERAICLAAAKTMEAKVVPSE